MGEKEAEDSAVAEGHHEDGVDDGADAEAHTPAVEVASLEGDHHTPTADDDILAIDVGGVGRTAVVESFGRAQTTYYAVAAVLAESALMKE